MDFKISIKLFSKRMKLRYTDYFTLEQTSLTPEFEKEKTLEIVVKFGAPRQIVFCFLL